MNARQLARLIALTTLLAWLRGAAIAAAPDQVLSYTVSITSTGDRALDRALAESSRLVALAERAPVGAFGLIARAEADLDRLDRVLRGFGYYDALPAVRISGYPLNTPDLMARLAALPAGRPVAVAVETDPGPLYRLGTLILEGDLPPEARAAFDLSPGAPAKAADVLAAGEAVLSALQETGHALARLPPPEALVDHDTRTLDVTYRPEPGPRLGLGELSISGLDRLRVGWVRRRLGLTPGEPYSPSRLEAARRSLLASGAVAWARLIPSDSPDIEGRLPLTLELAERPRRSLRLSWAYSSDEGMSAALSWLHRNPWGGAEQLTLRGEVKGLADGGLADLGKLGYLAEVALRVPDLWRRDLDLRLDLAALSESTDAYDRDAVTAGLALERRFSERLLASAGLAWEHSRITQGGAAEDYRLLTLPMTFNWDTTDSPLDPRRGARFALRVSPTRDMTADSPAFTLMRAVASAYLDLGSALDRDWTLGGWRALGAAGPSSDEAPRPGQGETTGADRTRGAGRVMLAGRLVLGTLRGADAGDVPPDWRFYAGGGGSVRGYPFQSIGPSTPSGSPAGGNGLLEASLELRLTDLCCTGESERDPQSSESADNAIGGLTSRVRRGWGSGPWGAVLFADAAAVSLNGIPGAGSLAVGVGIGLRYRTPVGPLRVDLATPLSADRAGGPIQLYIGIGQAF